jgi:hypothetical protein
MKKGICLLFLMLTACAPVPSLSTATPTLWLTSTPIPSSTFANTPTPDPVRLAFDALRAEGINVEHMISNANGGWELMINGEPVPGAFFDEQGVILHIKNGDKDIQITPDFAADRLELTPDGKLLLNNGEGVNIGMFNPQNPEAGWMIFDYKMVNPAEITAEQLAGISGIELVVDAEGNVHLPENMIAFENANAKPFPAEAVPADWGYKEFPSSGRAVFSGEMTSERNDLWFNGEFAKNPNLRDKRAAFLFKVNDDTAKLLGAPNGDLWMVANQYMNKPEEGKEKNGGFFHILISGNALRKFIEKGFFKDGGGFLIPALKAPDAFGQMYPPPDF